MKITNLFLDDLTVRAKASPRLRMNLDLRTSPEDGSQRMLNALEPGTVIPIHRHRKSTETVVLIRGTVRQNYYDDSGNLTDSFIAAAPLTPVFACAKPIDRSAENSSPADSPAACFGFSVPLGQWHNTECLESGTVFIECKDGAYEPLGEEDVMK